MEANSKQGCDYVIRGRKLSSIVLYHTYEFSISCILLLIIFMFCRSKKNISEGMCMEELENDGQHFVIIFSKEIAVLSNMILRRKEGLL